MEEKETPEQLIASTQDPMILVRHGIRAAKEERWGDGVTILAAAYEQLTKRTELMGDKAAGTAGTATLKDLVPASALSYYGLCLAHSYGNYDEAAKFIQIAIHNEPMVGEHYLVLAKLWKHARNRRKLEEAITKGLDASPRYLPLRRLALEVGTRKQPVIGFLGRNHSLNQTLGRLRAGFERRRLEKDLNAIDAEIARKTGRDAPPAGRPAEKSPPAAPPPDRKPTKE
jgi:hypothetical protein